MHAKAPARAVHTPDAGFVASGGTAMPIDALAGVADGLAAIAEALDESDPPT